VLYFVAHPLFMHPLRSVSCLLALQFSSATTPLYLGPRADFPPAHEPTDSGGGEASERMGCDRAPLQRLSGGAACRLISLPVPGTSGNKSSSLFRLRLRCGWPKPQSASATACLRRLMVF